MANIASAFFWYDWFKNNNSPKAIISPTKTSQAQENKAEKVPTEIPAEKKEMSEKQVFQEQKPSFFTYPKTEKKKNHLFVPASKKSISGFYDDPLDNFWPDDLVDQVFNNDPFFSRHRNMMQRLYDPFHNHFGVSPRSMKHFSQFSQQYPLDLEDKGDYLLATIDIPNFDPQNVSVEVKNNGRNLVLRGKNVSAKLEENQNKKYYYRERSSGQFLRQIPLPYSVDKSKSKALFQNGSLVVTMPKTKREESSSDGIEIEIK